MVITSLQLRQKLSNYASPKAKITQMIKNGQIIQLKRGLFLEPDDRNYSTFSISSLIYGPSYVSFTSALSWYGLIPESVPAITCAIFNKNRNKEFHTPIGSFYYYEIPAIVFSSYVLLNSENEQNFLIASPEKAVCDSLSRVRSIATLPDLENLLENDWRIDIEHLLTLDRDIFQFLLPLYGKKICNLFQSWLLKEV
jgi:predicted transcriptional regulator of viral defense system